MFFIHSELILLYNDFHSVMTMSVERLDVLVPHSYTSFTAACADALGKYCPVDAYIVEARNVEPEK